MTTNKPTAANLVPDARALYQRHAAGCCLHIALDDGNTSDSSADFCVRYAVEQGHRECEHLARQYRALSRTQRKRLRYLLDMEETS